MEKSPVVLDDKKFALYGKRTDKGVPKMSFSVFNGNPAIGVFTNDPADTETKPIRAGMDGLIWAGFVSLFKEMITMPNDSQLKVLNRKGPPTKTFVDSMTIIGKDIDGIIYLAIKQGQRPIKKFNILPGIYTDFVNKDGSPLSDGEKSVLYAKGFIEQLNAQVTIQIDKTYKLPEPFGGMQKPGGYQKPKEFAKPAQNAVTATPSTIDDGGDDLPF
jgi:hypothetical protein